MEKKYNNVDILVAFILGCVISTITWAASTNPNNNPAILDKCAQEHNVYKCYIVAVPEPKGEINE